MMVRRHNTSVLHGQRAEVIGKAARQREDKRRGGDHTPKASETFDWDTALYVFARSMLELGYPLSPEQRKRIDDHAH